ncbi:MAG: universal stress protein [Dehalococcoidia bacterium]|nr:MAG: universal stress protein [Dehalococcoidia bacterium]
MTLYKKILIAMDGSEHAKHALNYALESAVKWSAELIILTIVPPISPLVYSSEFNAPYIPELEDALRESHQRILNEAANTVKNKQPDMKVETRLEEGRPSDVIVEVAKEEDVDLIVLGSRGMGGIVDFLGSTSRHVVEACTKPILIVK